MTEFVQRYGGVLAAALLAACAAGGPRGGEVARVPEGAAREPEATPAVIGAILPRGGSPYLDRYAELILEGIELAIAEHEAAGGRRVRLEVREDGGDPERAAAAVVALEAAGALAMVGPLVPASVTAAATARGDSLPVLIDPLAAEPPAVPNAYGLNAPDTRGAEALARYAAGAGMRRVASLYPRSPEYRSQARAFAAALAAEGGTVVMEVAYDSGTTTFAEQLKALAEAEPQALYIPAPERDVHQIAPQITYYGLAGSGVKVLGGEGWTAQSVRDQVPARYLDGVVAVTPLPRSNPEVGWADLVARYEQRYRRSLDSPLPALGYDAARLILAAVDGGAASPADVARRILALRDVRGATGVLSVEGGRIVRRPFVVRIVQGELVPAARPEPGPRPPAPDAGWRGR